MTQLWAAQTKPSDGKTLYGGKGTRRITVRDIALAKERGEEVAHAHRLRRHDRLRLRRVGHPRPPRGRLGGQLSTSATRRPCPSPSTR